MATQAATQPVGYETTYITRPEMSDEALGALREKLAGVVKRHKGDLIHSEDQGKRKLAYTIKRESRGHYTYLAYTGDEGVVSELERNLRIQEQVIRFLTVSLGDDYDAEKIRKRNQPGAPKPFDGSSEDRPTIAPRGEA